MSTGLKDRFTVNDVFDVTTVRSLIDSFCDAVGIAAAIIDLKGAVIIGSRWQKLCTDFYRVHPETFRGCIESDTILANTLQAGKNYALYTCANGLADAAAPIIIEGNHIANFFVGQFFLAPPDEDAFKQKAAALGFDMDGYGEALSRVPVVPPERIPGILGFLTGFAELLGSLGLQKIRQVEISRSLKAREQELSGVNQQLEAINQQLRAGERELRESKEFLENVFEAAGDALIITDTAGSIIRVNRKAELLLGAVEPELRGGRCTTFLSLADTRPAAPVPLLEQLFENGCVEAAETLCRRTDGSVLPAEVNIRFMSDSHGDIIGAVWSCRDITERKRAEEEKMRLVTAIEQAEEIIFITDLSGCITYVNPAYERVTGYTRAEIVGQHTSIQAHHTQDKAQIHDMIAAVGRGEVWKGHVVKKRKDGAPYEVEVILSPIRNSSGEALCYVSVERDVTRELEMQQRLQQAQKMEAIGTFAGGIAHDFNNILSAIIGYAELARTAVGEAVPVQRYLREVLRAADRARNLVMQILMFSRQTDQEVRPVSVTLIATEVLKFLRASLPSTISISTSFSAESDRVLADSTQIHQLLMNLCANAKDAMIATGGVLHIALENVTVHPDSASGELHLHQGTYLKLTVSDTGCGMDQRILERLYDPFFTTKEQGQGTGLGLSVVHGIVKKCNGETSVRSEPGRGTAFAVYLPLAHTDTPAAETGEAAMIRGGTEHILVVDDEEQIVAVTQGLLEGLGYQVCGCTSAPEALALFCKDPEKYDLVITDQTMPRLTGYDLARQMLAIRADVPIILATGHSETLSEQEAKASGIREFIMKPVVRKTLAAIIRRVLDAGTMNSGLSLHTPLH